MCRGVSDVKMEFFLTQRVSGSEEVGSLGLMVLVLHQLVPTGMMK